MKPGALLLFAAVLGVVVGCRRNDLPGPSRPVLEEDVPATADATAADPATAAILYPVQHQTAHLAFRPDGRLWSVAADGLALWTAGEEVPLLYGPADGLPATAITDLLVAGDGTLWGSSMDGVFHQAGDAWVTYGAAEGLPSTDVRALALAPGGTLWAGTARGLARFDGRAWQAVAATVPLGPIAALFSDGDGRLWLQTEAGVMGHFDGDSGRWTPLGTDGLPDGSGRLLGVSSGGVPWAYASYDHVYRWRDGRWRQVGELGGGTAVCDLHFGATDVPWLATCNGYRAYGSGVLRLVDGSWRVVPTGPAGGQGTTDVRTLALGPHDALATATADGIYLSDGAGWHTLRHGPSRRGVKTVAVDGQGHVWMGFGYHTTPPNTAPFARFDGRSWAYAPGGDANLLRTAPDGTVWAAKGCTLQRLVGDGWQAVSNCEQLFGQVTDVAFAGDGTIWAAAGFSLGQYDDGAWSRVERLAHQVEIAPDGTVWVLGWHGSPDSNYIASFDGERWDERPNDEAGELAITADGEIWLVGESALFRRQENAWVAVAQPLPAIRHVLVEGATLWLFGDHAIARRDPAGGAWATTTYGTVGNPVGVADAALDEDGVLWLGTNQGLVRFDPAAITPAES